MWGDASVIFLKQFFVICNPKLNQMIKPLTVLFFAGYTATLCAQTTVPELSKLTASPLYNVSDTSGLNISGDWSGEEVEYDRTKSYIVDKFEVSFKLRQEGNMVSGTSYIKDKLDNSVGEMKIRGIVLGDRFQFEEYEIISEKINAENTVWCLRSGEMQIKPGGAKSTLLSIDYKGYASNDYGLCDDHSEMWLDRTNPVPPVASKPVAVSGSTAAPAGYTPKHGAGATGTVSTAELGKIWNNKGKYELKIAVNPNPCSTVSMLSFNLETDMKARIDIYNFSGDYIETLVNKDFKKGGHELKFDMTAYKTGVYIITLRADSYYCTRQIVKSKT